MQIAHTARDDHPKSGLPTRLPQCLSVGSKGIDMDLEKLTQDCIRARSSAIQSGLSAGDGGSANLDAAFLPIGKGVRSAKVVDAVMRGGLRAHATTWIGRGVMIQPPGDGQAGRRYAANEALISSLASAGWGVIGYY